MDCCIQMEHTTLGGTRANGKALCYSPHPNPGNLTLHGENKGEGFMDVIKIKDPEMEKLF